MHGFRRSVSIVNWFIYVVQWAKPNQTTIKWKSIEMSKKKINTIRRWKCSESVAIDFRCHSFCIVSKLSTSHTLWHTHSHTRTHSIIGNINLTTNSILFFPSSFFYGRGIPLNIDTWIFKKKNWKATTTTTGNHLIRRIAYGVSVCRCRTRRCDLVVLRSARLTLSSQQPNYLTAQRNGDTLFLLILSRVYHLWRCRCRCASATN